MATIVNGMLEFSYLLKKAEFMEVGRSTEDGLTGDITSSQVQLISPPSHSTTGWFLGFAVPSHQHLQSFPKKPFPGQVLFGQ